MNLATVMDQVAARLDSMIPGLRCFPFPPDAVTPPAAIVSYPEDYIFDATFGRGMDSMTLPIVLVVGKVSDRAARVELAAYCDGSGPRSVKQVLQGGAYTAFHTIHVMDIEFDVVTIAGADYMAATFTTEIKGPGS